MVASPLPHSTHSYYVYASVYRKRAESRFLLVRLYSLRAFFKVWSSPPLFMNENLPATAKKEGRARLYLLRPLLDSCPSKRFDERGQQLCPVVQCHVLFQLFLLQPFAYIFSSIRACSPCRKNRNDLFLSLYVIHIVQHRKNIFPHKEETHFSSGIWGS